PVARGRSRGRRHRPVRGDRRPDRRPARRTHTGTRPDPVCRDPRFAAAAPAGGGRLMSSHAIDRSADPVRPADTRAVTVTVDGTAYVGIEGQTLAGVLLAAGRDSWRQTSGAG